MGAADPIADDEPEPPRSAGVVTFRCDNCGAPVTAEPGADALICGHCGHRQAIARKDGRVVEYDFETALRDAPRGSASDLATGAHEVECRGCGARTVTAGQSQTCAFCGSPLIADLKRSETMMLPESLLPHKVGRDGAKTAFQAWLSSRWFAPNDLVRRSKAAGLDGVMLPHWTYDSNTTTSYHGLRGDHYWVSVSYTDSKGNSRTRMERRTRWSSRSGTVYVPFDDVLVCGSKSLPTKLVRELEPWDLAALQPFDPAYLAGFVTERYQIDLKEGFDLAADRMRPRIRTAIERDIGGDVQQILSMDVTHRDVTYKHLLLPLWISAFRYRDKVFRIVVNARTGEVQGERPWSWVKILLLSLLLAALLGGGIYLFMLHRSGNVDDVGEHQAPPPPTDYQPAPQPPAPPVLPVVDPLGQLGAMTTFAGEQLRGAALIGIQLANVDAAGTVRGVADVTFRRPVAAGAGRSCAGRVTLAADGLAWGDPRRSDACDEPLLVPPTCTLAAVMARVPAATWAETATAQVAYRVRTGAGPAEDPDGRRVPSTERLPGEWAIETRDDRVTVADDCKARAKPRPVVRPSGDRPRRPR